MVPAYINSLHISNRGVQIVALLCLYLPQDIVDPDDVAFVGGFVVDGDGGSGLDPQVASSPLEPAVVTGYHLAFPQHWEDTGGRWKERMYNRIQEMRGGKKDREEACYWFGSS